MRRQPASPPSWPRGTAAGGLRRVAWALRARPEVAMVALGATDGLRGLPLADLRENLERIVRRFQEAAARVLLRDPLAPAAPAVPYAPRPPPATPTPKGIDNAHCP